jgi:hypothetical protein
LSPSMTPLIAAISARNSSSGRSTTGIRQPPSNAASLIASLTPLSANLHCYLAE